MNRVKQIRPDGIVSRPQRSAWHALGRELQRLHNDQQGDSPQVNTLLILALISIPLLIILIFFGKTVAEWAMAAIDRLRGTDPIPSPDGGP